MLLSACTTFALDDMTNKEKYKNLCLTEESIPIYSRDWWLDTVCGESLWEVLLYENGGVIEAAMPIYLPTKGVIAMPPYAQTMGIWFNPQQENDRYSKELLRKQQICTSFLEGELSGYRCFSQNFHHTFTDWLPFYWKGYKQTTRYTYILSQISDTESVWANFSKDFKKSISKAREKYKLTVKRNIPVDDFLNINTKTYQRQGKETYHQEVLGQLVNECRRRGQGDIWGAYDEQGRLHVAVFIAWQSDYAYVMASGGDPMLRSSGAKSLIMWEAILFLSTITKALDFEGSMVELIGFYNRKFNAVQVPYFSISKGRLTLLDRALIKLKRKKG